MILGQSAATAACMAIDEGLAVQDVDYKKLKRRLEADGQVLEYDVYTSGNGVDPRKLSGVVVDNSKATRIGFWKHSTASKIYLGTDYQHDDRRADGQSVATFLAKFGGLPKNGVRSHICEVRLAYTPNKNRATNVPVTIKHSDGLADVNVDQTKIPPIDGLFISLGKFRFERFGEVTVSNKGTDGYVVIDGVQWLPTTD